LEGLNSILLHALDRAWLRSTVVADLIPLDPDESFVCFGCGAGFTRKTALDAVRFGDFWFCSAACERDWIVYSRRRVT
jgi:hypothetical protein